MKPIKPITSILLLLAASLTGEEPKATTKNFTEKQTIELLGKVNELQELELNRSEYARLWTEATSKREKAQGEYMNALADALKAIGAEGCTPNKGLKTVTCPSAPATSEKPTKAAEKVAQKQ